MDIALVLAHLMPLAISLHANRCVATYVAVYIATHAWSTPMYMPSTCTPVYTIVTITVSHNYKLQY